MQIFEQEIIDGLQEKIIQNTSISFQVLPQISHADLENQVVKKAIAGYIEDGRNFDLYHISSILASVGPNKNDDWFLPEEIWAARETPVYKQVNFGHNEKDIIGVITDTALLGKDGSYITSIDDIQNISDIVSHAVIWSYWEDKDLQERLHNIISDIENNKLFVSMESLFKHFDYVLVSESNVVSIVKRTKETAFLSKYLRIYNPEADGTYEGRRIYRLLRNFTFSGKALVENPANGRSIISDLLYDADENKEDKLESEQSKASCCDDCQDHEDDDDDYEIVQGSFEDSDDDFSAIAEEEDSKKKKLNKPFRTPNGPKKFSVYVKNDKGNIVKVNFGDPNMSIKRDDPERRKAFRSRHNCDNPGPKWKARYWSCKFWSTPSVTKLLAENIMENPELVALKAELVAAKAELEAFKKSEAEKVIAEINELKAANESLTKQVAEMTQLAQAAKDAMEKEKVECEAAKKQAYAEKDMMKEECEAKVAEAEKVVASMKAEIAKAGRLSKLTSANVEAAKAEEILNTWASVSDEHFEKLVELYAVKTVAGSNSDVQDGLETAKASTNTVNPNTTSGVEKAVAKERELAEKIAAQFNFTKKKKSE